MCSDLFRHLLIMQSWCLDVLYSVIIYIYWSDLHCFSLYTTIIYLMKPNYAYELIFVYDEVVYVYFHYSDYCRFKNNCSFIL